ncbi:hypothetical protein [Serratia sp. PL7]|uniref:hypothetical protein n=1 Tax=Serratia sp. PL7 TaxID=2952201 RepID=UPI0021ADD203|nr:hypothetical protein [Serratia sp. PL7]
MLPVKSEQPKHVDGSLLRDKQHMLYREPVGFKATAFPNGEPETPLQHLAQTTSHVNRYIRQLDELYATLLADKIRAVDVQIAGRFQGLLNELLLLSIANKNRAESLMNAELPGCMSDISLTVSSQFTGKVVVHIEDGKLKSHYTMQPTDHIATLGGFIEMAERAGWMITSPEESENE